MGCFLACFGSSKEEKRRNHRKHKLLLRQQINRSPNNLQHHIPLPEKVITADPPNVNLNTDLTDGLEEESSLITRKKVTFDTNVKTYEPISVHESAELFSETEKSVEDQRGDSSDNSSILSNSRLEDGSITSSVGLYPANHRYQNCRDSDDEIEEFICDDSDLDDENDNIEDYSDCDEDENEALEQKVWAESVPTASMESRVEISSNLAAAEEVNSPMVVSMLAEKEGKSKSFNRNIHSVLNPVENIAQWKAAKSKATPILKQQKENFTAKQEESRLSFSYMSKSDQTKNQNEHISVDASLSSWLSPSKSAPSKRTSHVEIETERSYSQGSNSAISSLIEDRPILGALTVEEIKQFSASNSPRKSPSRSPDEMAIIGTVGRYWNSSGGSAEEDYSSASSSYKGIPNSTSKYREDKKVIWHSTPFETRLERALKRGDIES